MFTLVLNQLCVNIVVNRLKYRKIFRVQRHAA